MLKRRRRLCGSFCLRFANCLANDCQSTGFMNLQTTLLNSATVVFDDKKLDSSRFRRNSDHVIAFKAKISLRAARFRVSLGFLLSSSAHSSVATLSSRYDLYRSWLARLEPQHPRFVTHLNRKLNFEPHRMRFSIVHQLQHFQAPHSKWKKLMNPQVGSLLLLLLSIFTIIVFGCAFGLWRGERVNERYTNKPTMESVWGLKAARVCLAVSFTKINLASRKSGWADTKSRAFAWKLHRKDSSRQTWVKQTTMTLSGLNPALLGNVAVWTLSRGSIISHFQSQLPATRHEWLCCAGDSRQWDFGNLCAWLAV